MPLYEFVCKTCGHTEELICKYDDPPPICQHGDDKAYEKNTAEHMEKKLSTGTSFILKGNGWYKTDYGKKWKPVLPVN